MPGDVINSSPRCGYDMTGWNEHMDKMYTYFYLLLFIPGLLLNTTAVWVLCKHISKKTKAVIYMINLALADLAHILSLPLRIYYYFTHSWPFGPNICLFCFYLKYLNMYAAIVFLVCISVQRCIFLLNPFSARQWRRRYDLLISAIVWVVVGLACSPFILMRSNPAKADNNVSSSMPANVTLPPFANTSGERLFLPSDVKGSCFKDLPMRPLNVSLAATMMALAELFGFVIPFICISYSSVRIVRSLQQRQDEDDMSSAANDSSGRSRLQSITSSFQVDREKHSSGEKQRALRMVLSCSALFLLCFAPYHINFLLYLMVKQNIISHCGTQEAVLKFHPVSLCLASLSCCLNPLLYYFLNAEFRQHLRRHTQSFNSSILSSPVSPPTDRALQHRLTSMESSCSDRE